MTAARFDLIREFSIQHGGDFKLTLQFFDPNNAPVAASGPLSFRLFNSLSGRGTPVLEVDFTLDTNTAELVIPEIEVNTLTLRRGSYSITGTSVPVLGGYCDIIPLATGAAQSNAPLRITQNLQTIRVTATNLLTGQGEKGDPGDPGPKGDQGDPGPKGDDGASDLTGAVRYDVAQSLSAGEQNQGQQNLGVCNVAEFATASKDELTLPPVTINGVAVDYAATPPKIYIIANRVQDGAYIATPGPTFTKLPTFSGYVKTGGFAGEYFVCGPDSAVHVEPLPRLGTASALNAPATGDAAADEVMLGSDSRNTNARAPTAHTHPLGDLQQSGATLGDNPRWNGTAWVPAAGGGMSIGAPVAGGVVQKILFVGTEGNLAQDPDRLFNYNSSNGEMKVGAVTTASVDTGLCQSFRFSFTGDELGFRKTGVNRVAIGATFVAPNNDGVIEIGGIKKKPYTSGTMPIAPAQYDQCLVVDALTPALGSVLVGGGTSPANVIWISPNWIII